MDGQQPQPSLVAPKDKFGRELSTQTQAALGDPNGMTGVGRDTTSTGPMGTGPYNPKGMTATQPPLLTSPKFNNDMTTPKVGQSWYLDKWGRMAYGDLDKDGNIIVPPAPPPKPLIPPKPTAPTTLPTVNNPPPAPAPLDPANTPTLSNIKGASNPPQVSLSNVSNLLGLGNALYSGYQAIGGADQMYNFGPLSFISNGIDQVGASTGYFTTAGATPGWTWSNETGFYELTDPAAVGSAAGKTTLSNALGYGSAGSFVAQVLGLGNNTPGLGGFALNTGAGLVGGAAGGAAGAAVLGETLGSVAGPIGALVGGFLATALVGWLGPHPSEKLAYGHYDASSGTFTQGSYQGAKYSPENNKGVNLLMQGTNALQNNITTTLGVNIDIEGGIGIGVDSRHGITVQVGGDPDVDNPDANGHRFANGLDAIKFIGKTMLQRATYNDPDTKYVASQLNWNSTDFDQAYGALSFAKDFQHVSNDFLAGNFTVDQDKDTSLQTIDAWANSAKTLFAGPSQDDYYAKIDRAVTAAKSKVFAAFANS